MARVKLEWSSVHEYTLSNVNTYAPASAGIYRLSYKGDDKLPIFYVGQADALEDRLRDHLSNEEPNDCIKRRIKNYICYFRFAHVTKQAERDCAERALYDHYEPECNKIAPPSEPCEINFS
jgi:excinuclease UvrABC nuclease subunit